MQRGTALLVPSLLCGLVTAGAAYALSEFGIEGMGVVSTPASEVRASVSPDGRRIVWGSTDRVGGAGKSGGTDTSGSAAATHAVL